MVTEQILAALTHDPLADTPHFASARLFALYNEVFCDRGSLLTAGDPLVVISMLLKVETQLDEVSPESYLRQADEIFSHAGGQDRRAVTPGGLYPCPSRQALGGP